MDQRAREPSPGRRLINDEAQRKHEIDAALAPLAAIPAFKRATSEIAGIARHHFAGADPVDAFMRASLIERGVTILMTELNLPNYHPEIMDGIKRTLVCMASECKQDSASEVIPFPSKDQRRNA